MPSRRAGIQKSLRFPKSGPRDKASSRSRWVFASKATPANPVRCLFQRSGPARTSTALRLRLQPRPSVQVSPSRVIANDNEIPGFRLALAIASLAGMTVESFIPPRCQAIRLKIRSSKSATNRITQIRITNSKIRNEIVWNCVFFDHLELFFESRISFPSGCRNRNRVPKNLFPICDLNLRAIGL